MWPDEKMDRQPCKNKNYTFFAKCHESNYDDNDVVKDHHDFFCFAEFELVAITTDGDDE